jgi:proteasome lid subunit RPN8/RPN11
MQVQFDGPWVLRREERQGDVIGFLHTHPGMAARPSRRDVRTMRAWCSAFGKPLLCLIAGVDGLRGWRFDDDAPNGVELSDIRVHRGGAILARD